MAATAPVNTVEASAKATQVDLGMQSAARAVLEQLGTGEISFSMDGSGSAGIYSFPYYIFSDEKIKANFNGIELSLNFGSPSDYYKDAITGLFDELSSITGISFHQVANRENSLFDIAMLDNREERISYYGSPYVLGMRGLYGNEQGKLWNLLTWRELSSDENEDREFAKARATRTIKHEVLHGLGLSHPDGPSGQNPEFNDLDTIMSYVNTDPAPNFNLTDADKIAIREVRDRLLYGSRMEVVNAGKKDLNLNKTKYLQAAEDGSGLVANRDLKKPGYKISDEASSSDDILKGGKRINSFEGDDIIYARKSTKSISGDDGYDRIYLAEGRQKVIIENGSEGYDSVINFSKNDRIIIDGYEPETLVVQSYGSTHMIFSEDDLIAVIDSNFSGADAMFGKLFIR